jgi:teichuronic acid biosynthesis glycosyltransferase TuaC
MSSWPGRRVVGSGTGGLITDSAPDSDGASPSPRRNGRLGVLVLSRSYPSDRLPALGLWVERPTRLLAEHCDLRVVAAVPWCPPFPSVGTLAHYRSFRDIPRRERREGIEVIRPRFFAGPGGSLYPYEARATFLGVRGAVDRLRETFPFDLIHAHMIYPEGAIAHRLSRRYGVPFIVTEHAPWTSAWFGRRSVREQALAAARAASQLLAVSTSVRDTIVAYTGDPRRVRVVPVGVDESTFTLGATATRRSNQILFVGWPNFNKGIDVLLKAMQMLKDGGEPGRLLLVGGSYYRDTRRQEEQLRRLARRLDLGERVTFLGTQPQAEVARLMAESAVLVLPSRAESFGAVLVEALACGTPVVATRCGGPEDIVRDEVGKLVDPDDARALADALSTVLRAPDLYEPERLRAYALARFGWTGIVDEIGQAYTDAVSTPGRRALAAA